MKTILVVDDEPGILDLLTVLLDEEGYVVLPVGDGVAALDVLAETAVDVVITDVMMPRLGGVGLIRAIRAREDGRSVPAILVSAGDRPSLDGLGASVFLAKPFDLDELLDAVHGAVSR
ncbi:MAG: response regulator [Chloroflexota bacterium]|nr:response regulator [Chloroflexota bacterium]